MKIKLNKIFTSGWDFEASELDLKSRFQMVNIALILSSFAFMYGIVVNIIYDIDGYVPLETFLLFMNVVMFFALRKFREVFELVATVITAQCTVLLLYIMYTSDPESMKHTWLFTYLIVLLYFQKRRNGIYWFIFMVVMLLIAPLQTFIDVQFTFFQVSYIVVVLLIVSIIVYFYQIKMNEARDLILQQQDMLLNFNTELEKLVKEKTTKLIELNESLEMKVQEKIDELIQKDKLLSVQAKQAVMGEMISMIAHQWRQPLSTITLQISNLQFRKLLGEEIDDEEIDATLIEISDNIMYLSQTIDDFQTYFHPNKESSEIEVHELLRRAVNFTLPRLKETNLDITIKKEENVYIRTYINELIQVILNIVNNAIDAFKTTNKTDSKVIISVEEFQNKIIVLIEDNATGITEKNLPHIFEPYFSTKGKNGTGLGLYMSQMIVQKQFNGEISVQNLGDGVVFKVEIPKNIF